VTGAEEFVVVRVRDGELQAGNWVYAWIDKAGPVVYVGATGLDPRTRVWLHVHDPDPTWDEWQRDSDGCTRRRSTYWR